MLGNESCNRVMAEKVPFRWEACTKVSLRSRSHFHMAYPYKRYKLATNRLGTRIGQNKLQIHVRFLSRSFISVGLFYRRVPTSAPSSLGPMGYCSQRSSPISIHNLYCFVFFVFCLFFFFFIINIYTALQRHPKSQNFTCCASALIVIRAQDGGQVGQISCRDPADDVRLGRDGRTVGGDSGHRRGDCTIASYRNGAYIASTNNV